VDEALCLDHSRQIAWSIDTSHSSGICRDEDGATSKGGENDRPCSVRALNLMRAPILMPTAQLELSHQRAEDALLCVGQAII
jgi:hypothetical protein